MVGSIFHAFVSSRHGCRAAVALTAVLPMPDERAPAPDGGRRKRFRELAALLRRTLGLGDSDLLDRLEKGDEAAEAVLYACWQRDERPWGQNVEVLFRLLMRYALHPQRWDNRDEVILDYLAVLDVKMGVDVPAQRLVIDALSRDIVQKAKSFLPCRCPYTGHYTGHQ